MTAPAPAPQEWRIQQAIAMQRADKSVLAQLKASQTALNARLKALAARPGFSNSIREAQLRLAKREIQLEMANLFRKIGDVTSAMRLEAAARVLKVNEQLDAFRLLGAGLPDGADVARAIADAELDAARSGVDRMIARVQGANYNSLSQRVYTAASGLNGPISTLVNNALAAGLSAREFANAAKDFINPLTPGGTRYAAYRLARTEINNAAHAVAVDAVQDKPWVSGMKWHLSGSHPRVDICNSLASGGPKNDGIYPKTSVPAKPHPHCFCYVTPETDDEEEFLDNLISGHYDEYLEKYRNLKPGEILRSNVSIPHPPATSAAKTLPGARAGTSRSTPSATPLKPSPAPSKADILRRGIASGVKSAERVGGVSAEATERVLFNDGSTAIKKTIRKDSYAHESGKFEADAEELGAIVSRAMGFETPAVVRTSEREMYFEFMDGKLAVDLEDEGYGLLNGPGDGIKLRLMDLLITNSDRNTANFLAKGSRLQPIDHGSSFLDWDAAENQPIGSPLPWRPDQLSKFSTARFDSKSYQYVTAWIENPLSSRDVKKVQQALDSARSEFRRLGHEDWYESMLARWQNIAAHAKGTRDIL